LPADLEILKALSSRKWKRYCVSWYHWQSLKIMPHLLQVRGRPQLAPALVLSALSSTALLLIAFVSGRVPYLHVFLVVPIFTIAHNLYYLAYLLHLRPTIRAGYEALDGVDSTWPHSGAIFTGKKSQRAYIFISFLSVWAFLVGRNVFMTLQGTFELRWPQDSVEILTRVFFVLQIISSLAVFFQGLAMRAQEDRVLCLSSHDWQCSHCSVTLNDPSKNEMPNPLNSNPETSLKITLGLSMALNAIIYTLPDKSFMEEQWGNISTFVVVLPILTILHNFVAFTRLMTTQPRRNSSLPWPATPFFGRKWTIVLYYITLGILLEVFTIVGPFILAAADWKFWSRGALTAIIIVVWLLETALLVVGVLQAHRMYRWECKACCVLNGHRWGCSRLQCKAKYDLTAAELLVVRS
jgi:hypothetical protein